MRTYAPLLVLLCAACTATVIPGSVPTDTAPSGDAGAVVDTPAVTDTSTLPDATSSVDLTGRWRIVRYIARVTNGEAIELTDEPTLYTDTVSGGTAMLRVNGFLHLTQSRFAMTIAALVDDHIRGTGQVMGMDTFSASGIATSGRLDNSAGRFEVTGGRVSYALTMVGDNLRVEFSPSFVAELTRTGEIPGHSDLDAVGLVERLRPLMQRPLTRPRVALFWVRPMQSALTEHNDVELEFWRMPSGALFPLTLVAPPERSVRFELGGVPLATAMIVVYDDLNNNRVMDLAAGDSLRGISNVTLVWRGAGGDPNTVAFRQSDFASLGAGYHFAWRVRDYSTGGVTLLPFDGDRPVSPDAPVSPTELDPLALESAWR